MTEELEGGFVKLYGDRLLRSSLMDRRVSTRWVFVVMLSGANSKGFFRCANASALARAANVTLRDAEKAIEELEAPDPDSTTPDNDGRRILRVAGGWQIVTHAKYRKFRSAKQIRDAERQRKHRTKKEPNQPKRDVSQLSQEVTASRPEAEAEADTEKPKPLARTSSAPPPDPKAYWDHAIQNVVIDEDWLRVELAEHSKAVGVFLNRAEYDEAHEDLRRNLLANERLRACIQKLNGKPSTPAKFKALATYTVSHFKRALNRKAKWTRSAGSAGRAPVRAPSQTLEAGWEREREQREREEAKSIAACPADHEREKFLAPSGRVWLCPKQCGWTELVKRNQEVGK